MKQYQNKIKILLKINTSLTISALLKGTMVLFLLFISSNSYSQRLTLEGKVSTVGDIDLEGINIYNVSSQKGTVTNAEGVFFIAVSLNDTLSISSIQIQDKIVIIGKQQLLDKKINIHLSERLNELNTVTLRRALTGFIGTDANIIPTVQPITATSIGLPNADLPQIPKTQRLLYAANSGPVDALINMFSGRTKRLKKYVELEKTSALTLALLDKFPETYFTDGLKIDKLKVYSFLFFCEDDPNYKTVMKESNIEIIEFLQKKSKEFRLKMEQ